MDPWKPIRLWLCIAVCVAFLAVGGYARLVWGVPEAPYGWRAEKEDEQWWLDDPRTNNPFQRIRDELDLWRQQPPQ